MRLAAALVISLQVMCADYGFREGNMRLYEGEYGSVPGNAFKLVRLCSRVLLLVCGFSLVACRCMQCSGWTCPKWATARALL